MTMPHLTDSAWRGGAGLGDEPGKSMGGRPAPGGNSVPRGREPMPRSTTTAGMKHLGTNNTPGPAGMPSAESGRTGRGIGDEPGKGRKNLQQYTPQGPVGNEPGKAGTLADKPTGTVVPERRGASDGYKLMRDRR
jgi:hypothetical protein